MKTWRHQGLENSALALLSAVLFVSFFQLNGWLFSAFEHSKGVNWVFLPAGFRVILVLLLGLPGAVGLMLGSWFLEWYLLEDFGLMLAFLNGIASGLAPWLVMKLLQYRRWLSDKLHSLNTAQLLNLTLMSSAVSALAHQLVWWLLDRPNMNLWLDIWPMFIGNVVGALVMLYSFKLVLTLWRGEDTRVS